MYIPCIRCVRLRYPGLGARSLLRSPSNFKASRGKHTVDLSSALVVLLVCGVIAGAIAHRKQRSFGTFFVLGFLLGVFGILWAVLIPPGAPAGMRSVTCRRCNKRQNIPESQTEFQCWQCKFLNSVGQAIGPEDGRQWLTG
jgi:phage FluMu protein Com